MEHIKEIQSFMRLAEAQLHEAVKAYDMKQLEMAGNLIQEAEQKGCRIHVTGIGKPAHLAGYAASLLSSTGTPAYFLDGYRGGSWKCRSGGRAGCGHRHQQFREYCGTEADGNDAEAKSCRNHCSLWKY